ncbi:replication protein [Salmonella enterica]|nr:replication protein [Salmonella enterica subsp. enterica serovar Poona]EHK4261921.1 replication protein [Salmonella enterica subsp. enterica serovar Minnesota]EHK4495504.1 replication protein [Salmonella enterica]QVB00372.1 replication protein [Salmonella enterica subsp. enterica serovar Irumu]EHK4757024.1 replication protein [Salmonella enterica]
MSTSIPTDTVVAIGQINLTGNVIPASWWRHIRLPSGRPDQTAITLLAEIVYWYRPSEVRDEITGALVGYRKRFHGDKLQRSYQAFADQFGFSKRETTDALKRLRDAGLITLELRTIQTSEGLTLSNVLYVEPVPDAVLDINSMVRKSDIKNVTPVPFERNTPSVPTEPLPRSDVDDPTLKRETYTEITTETTTEIKNTGADADAPPPKRQKKSSFDPAGLKPENVSAEIWQDWIKFRREKRQPLTETTCTYQAKQLAGHQNADEVIRRSIAGGWQGLFPERVPNKPAMSLAENETMTASQPLTGAWCTLSGNGSAEVFINQAAIERLRRGGHRQ